MYTQSGRSMVEMLGVLAIIGVLSVGAISGYSKAMNKYKLNKAIDAANHLFASVVTNVVPDNSVLSDDSEVYYTETMAKAGWLPDGLTFREADPRFADDAFNNPVWIFKKPAKAVGVGWGFMRGQKALCMAFVNLAKEWQNDIDLISIDHHSEDIEDKSYGRLYGNKSCSANVKCLKDVTVTEIDTVCNNCENWVCRFYFHFNKF